MLSSYHPYHHRFALIIFKFYKLSLYRPDHHCIAGIISVIPRSYFSGHQFCSVPFCVTEIVFLRSLQYCWVHHCITQTAYLSDHHCIAQLISLSYFSDISHIAQFNIVSLRSSRTCSRRRRTCRRWSPSRTRWSSGRSASWTRWSASGTSSARSSWGATTSSRCSTRRSSCCRSSSAMATGPMTRESRSVPPQAASACSALLVVVVLCCYCFLWAFVRLHFCLESTIKARTHIHFPNIIATRGKAGVFLKRMWYPYHQYPDCTLCPRRG